MNAGRRGHPRLVSRLAALALLLATALASAGDAAAANQTRLRIDRVIAEPAWLQGMARLRIYATAVTLQGAFVPVIGEPGKGGFVLKIGASKKKIPYLTGMYGGTDEPLSVGIVVLTGHDYVDDFPEIQRELAKLIDALPKDAKVSVVSYSDTVHATPRLSPAAAARKLERLFPDTAPVETELIKAVSRAIRIVDRIKLKPPHTSARKMVIVVSDGKDLDFDPKRFKKAAREAERNDVRIHSLAFSPEDNRRPLLGLGELSKRSLGTFRWVRQSGLFAGQVKPLTDEIADQYILTYFVPIDDVDGKRVSLLAGDIESNRVKIKVRCGEASCAADQYCAESACVTRAAGAGSSIVAWVLFIVGGLVGLLMILAAVGFVLSRRKPRPMPNAPGQMPPGQVPGMPPGQAPDGGESAQSSHRIVAVDAQGNPIGGAPAPRMSAAHGAQTAGRIQPMMSQQMAAQAAPAAGQGVTTTAVLYVVKGPNPGQTLPVSHGFTIGSQPGLHLSLIGDGFASHIHAQILMDTAGNCTIVDKGSTNGTFVNGVRTNSMKLTHGNTITIGGAEFRFLIQ